MSTSQTFTKIAAIIALGSCLSPNEASATLKHYMGGAANDTRNAEVGCRGVVHLTYPALKGADFRAQVQKCAADPNAYGKS